MLNVFVCEALTARTLREPDAFAKCLVVGFAVCCVQCRDWIAALNADRHAECLILIVVKSRGLGGNASGI